MAVRAVLGQRRGGAGGGRHLRHQDGRAGAGGVGDLKMVTEWCRLGFIVRNPYEPAVQPAESYSAKCISIERTTGSRPDPKSEAS